MAAGAQLLLFTTGLGNSYVSEIAPTIKITANRKSAERLSEQIDFDASGLIDGSLTRASATQGLTEHLLTVAGGALTFGEILGEGNEVISRFGETL